MDLLMEDLFQKQQILTSKKLSSSQCDKLLYAFRFLISPKTDREAKLRQLDDLKGRQELINFSELNSETDPKILEEIRVDLSLVVKQMLKRHNYLSVEGSVALIRYFILLNRDLVYSTGKLTYHHLKDSSIHFESSHFMNQILK
jgi:hypothetical protein